MSSFKFVVNGELVSYDSYEDIPNDFEHVIEFVPDLPEPEGEDDNTHIVLRRELRQLHLADGRH